MRCRSLIWSTLAPDDHAQWLTADDPRELLRSCAPETLVAYPVARAEPPVDLIQGFAGPLSGKVIFHLLGVPAADQTFFQETSVRLLLATTPEDAEAALAELVSYLDELVASRRGDAGTWLLDRLVADEGSLSWDDLVRMAVQMLVTGQGSTAQMIALSTATLLEHPEQLDELRRDPALAPAAVEELLRYLTIADMAGIRVATKDIDLHGHVIRQARASSCRTRSWTGTPTRTRTRTVSTSTAR